MSIKPTPATEVFEDPDDSSRICIQQRQHACSIIAVREGWRVGQFGDSNSSNGADIRVWGEDENVDIPLAPIVDENFKCRPRNGFGKVQDRDTGEFGGYAPPCPEKQTIYSGSQFTTGETSAGPAGDVVIANLSYTLKTCCYPLNVEAYIDICDWRYEAPNARDVTSFASWQINALGEDGSVDTVQNDRKDLWYGSDGGSIRRDAEDLLIPAHSEYQFLATIGLKYEKEIIDSFPSRLGAARWVIKTEENVKLNASVEEEC